MSSRYSRPQIWLHWISAAIIIWSTLSGFYVALFNHDLQCEIWIGFLNVSLTTIYIPLFMLRIWFAWRHGKPADSLLSHKEDKLAAVGHMLLYSNIALVLITGVMMMEKPINVFGFFELPHPVNDNRITSIFHTVHIISCISLGLLIIGHILAVVKHQLKGKPLLRRMSW
ncbi:cytochrome b [Erwinia sp. DT-104]|uniref:cytochrome b n=1 Tax=Erwinia sp. DT-104 TaxID=3396161 RepID=UPI003F1CD3FE